MLSRPTIIFIIFLKMHVKIVMANDNVEGKKYVIHL